MRARSALFTVFGDVVRPTGGEAWLRALTTCMDALDFTPEATRTALHRMATEGWVEVRRDGRLAAYRLTERGADRLEEAAARIYRLRAAPWDGRWRLLLADRATTEDALVAELAWMGFGRLRPGVWVSPHDHGRRLDTLIERHGAEGALTLTTEAHATAEGSDRRIVEAAWDTTELTERHTEFIATWTPTPEPAGPREAFATRIRLVHHWRSFLFLDPGLPAALLDDSWRGDEAAETFAAAYRATASGTWDFYETAAALAAPDVTLPIRPSAAALPAGLAAEPARPAQLTRSTP